MFGKMIGYIISILWIMCWYVLIDGIKEKNRKKSIIAAVLIMLPTLVVVMIFYEFIKAGF